MTSSRAGFSIFEVLVAFAVMSLVLVALIPGQARLLARATEGSLNALAYDFALSKAAELGVTSPLEIGSNVGQYQDWTIVQTTKPIGAVLDGQLVETTIDVRDANGQQIALVTAIGAIHNDG